MPEKVHFRYKLEGLDGDWQDAGNRRQTFYNNLSPGNYRFRVLASNNSGVWNEAGAFLDFAIAPAYYQTTWFRLSSVAVFIALLWSFHELRLRQLNRRLEERRRAEEERERLRQAEAALERVTRVTTMAELTASLAHEINQPIAAAILNSKTCLRWLKRDQPDLEEAREAASRIINDVTRDADIIKRVRSMFKKGTAQREPVDVNEVIREVIVLLRDEAYRCSVSIHEELATDCPKAMADRVQLQQVFTNLMLNGIQAMKEVEATRELTVKSEQADGHLLISVSDTGVGLAPQQADQIFKAFYTTKPDGTGMGLRISRSIIESHGGRLWATANTGRGATFQFTLPSTVEGPE